ncbi:UNVERIFIED_ORG: hypothetical protein J2W38_005360 [Variovorax paradoxus]|nr:hypothetical protein [Variovorax paradoxus]
MPAHLSIRVPWHDARWNGTVCRSPELNCHCIEYENILAKKSVVVELGQRGQHFADLLDKKPPCYDESGGFLSARPWATHHEHPYKNWKLVADTHAHLERTGWTVEPFTAHAVPFRWLSRTKLDDFTQPRLVEALPSDIAPSGYRSDWVFLPEVQEAILDGFFNPIQRDRSLALFYTKSRHPIGDDIPRLLVGIGLVTNVGEMRYYESSDPHKRRHPIWQRDIAHSLRSDGTKGLLIPFHDYLESTGDPDEDARRLALARELVISPEPDRVVEFSYRSEHVSPDALVSILTQSISVCQKLRDHRIASGDWAAVEAWLNTQLAIAWKLRGPHPGLGPVLEAAGLRMGTSLVHLLAQTDTKFSIDPWQAISGVLEGRTAPPEGRFRKDIDAFASQWATLVEDKKRVVLARSLSRMAVTPAQAARWWDRAKRMDTAGQEVSDDNIVDNPYLVCELDRGGGALSAPITFATVDRGVVTDASGSDSVSPADRRRRRAALVSVLRQAELEGDTLLGIDEGRTRVSAISVPEPPVIPDDWVVAEADWVAQAVVVDREYQTVQTRGRKHIASTLQRKLQARCRKTLPALEEDWTTLLITTVNDTWTGPKAFDPTDARAVAALTEQAEALRIITSRKATVLVGRAGTGKTTVLGALSRASSLAGNVLFLAPTGKARVRLESRVAEGTTVMTVAQYLWQNRAYDGKRQRPLILDEGAYDGHGTVVVDESSMLTEDMLTAVLSTFTSRVQRLILVGDPAQLPPIGAGRPFADLVAHLDPIADFDDEDPDDVVARRTALARLRHEVRNFQGAASDTLRLAHHFTGDARIDGEEILVDLATGASLNDLDLRYWTTSEQLHQHLVSALQSYLEIKPGNVASFNASLGMTTTSGGFPIVGDPSGAEAWQILSPVRRNVWGVVELNRWVQATWRGAELANARDPMKQSWVRPFGPTEIIRLDKVILTENGERSGYDWASREQVNDYLANGEIGLCDQDKRAGGKIKTGEVMDIKFAGRAQRSYGFFRSSFGGGETGPGIIEHAYALTVHKAQGSDFGVVAVVLPRGRMAFRELIYTALTRSRQRLVLLVEGSDLSDLLAARSPERSDTVRRNSNLFRIGIRDRNGNPFARHLTHRASDGTLLASKSELFIYERAKAAGLRPIYEMKLPSRTGDKTWKLPDFTFLDDADDPIVFWEHLGMLDVRDYAAGWSRKRKWYADQGYVEGRDLVWTSEIDGLDAAKVDAVIASVKAQLDLT